MATKAIALPAQDESFDEAPLARSRPRDATCHAYKAAGARASSLIGEVEDLLRQATGPAAARDALTRARGLVGDVAAPLEVRRALLLLREKAGESDGLLQDIERIFQEAPDDRTILELYLRSLLRNQARDSALATLDAKLPADSPDAGLLVERAELLDRLKLHVESDAAYATALSLEDRTSIRVSWAKRLAKRFLFEDAGRLLDELSRPPSGEKARALKAEIDAERAFFAQFRSSDQLVGQDFRLVAMQLAVLKYRCRELRPLQRTALKLSLVTGNLGAGGAERQLCALAKLVKSSIADAVHHDDLRFSSVEVIVKEHARRGVSDFFLRDLQDAGVPVWQINEMKPVRAQQQAEIDSDLAHLMAMLPPQVHYGVSRLAPHFRREQPDVASLWQDGTCLIGALAALFAGVPRIQLVFRGLPPNIRINRYKPEYELLYAALAEVPGVEFVCNSLAGAQAYADWLGLPVDRINVLYNGVVVADDAPSESDVECWQAFEAATADATETIGGVFRFETDKRPLAWIRIAGAYARQRPKARFVIVGDGRLMSNAREKAERLGIADRILFAGSSHAVGFWYDKMDVKLLTSRYEGLPNVLIEAQFRGCPVVSTPAGGAAECFAPGVTGHLLDCAESPDLDQSCQHIRDLVDQRRADPDGLRERTLAFAHRFGVNAFLERFCQICGASLNQAVDA